MKKIFLTLCLLSTASVAHADFNPAAISQPYAYKVASIPTVTTNVKTGAGILHVLTVTGGTTSPIDIYDGDPKPSSLIYSFSTTNAIASYVLDIGFTSGCTVVTNGNGPKFTVSYL